MSDLFECFGSDDDEDDEVEEQQNIEEQAGNGGLVEKSKEQYIRDPNCGVCSQVHAEKSLLTHVKNKVVATFEDVGLNSTVATGDSDHDNSHGTLSKCLLVQKTIDDFCNQRAWMMHIGPEKGYIVQKALKESMDYFVARNTSHDHEKKRPFVCVELGTYCGYGSLCLAKTMYEYMQQQQNDECDSFDFHLFTMEVNPTYIQIAQEIIQICTLDRHVTIVESEIMLDGTTSDITSLLKAAFTNQWGEGNKILKGEGGIGIDFLLIDHDKDSYLADLNHLETSGMIHQGTTVVADNVIFAKIDNYISYMKQLAMQGIVRSKTIESIVEYSAADVSNYEGNEELFKDGIGKLVL